MDASLRTHLKISFSILLIVLLISKNAQSQQSPVSSKPIFVIVHGAWGGGWAFRVIDSLMTAEGCQVYRPSLTGQGERVHLATPEIGLNTHINDVVNMILYEDITDVILVGHSYGGMVISGVAHRVPDRIRKLVYLDAIVPESGESVFSIMGDGLMSMKKDGFIVPAWIKADQKPPKDVPQSLKTFTDTIELKNPAANNLPATYILTVDPGKKPEDDSFANSADRARQRGWKVVIMEADHNPQWSHPGELSRLLLQEK